MEYQVNSETFCCLLRKFDLGKEDFPKYQNSCCSEEKTQKKKKEKKKPVFADEPKKKYKFPKSKIVLDLWKKYVVNERDSEKKMKYIKENHDPNAYSFYKLDYDKMEDELVEKIYTQNMLTGFLDRCEGFRKNAYGFHCVLGEGKVFDLCGLWYWNSTEKLPNLEENPECEYYKYKKLDPNDEQDWAEITKFFTLNNLSEEELEKVTIDGKKLDTFKEYK